MYWIGLQTGVGLRFLSSNRKGLHVSSMACVRLSFCFLRFTLFIISSIFGNHLTIHYLHFLWSMKKTTTLKQHLLLASYSIRVMWLNEQRKADTACDFLWSGLLFPAQPGTVVVEVGGPCGFRWPVAVWEVRLLVAVGLPAYRKCPLPFPTPWLPVNAGTLSLWHLMRYTSRAVYLQGSETPLCINRAPIQIFEVIYLQTCPRTGMLKSVFLVMGIVAIHPNG